MTSPTTASDRRGLPTALGGYSSGLSAGRSSSAARSMLAAPAIGVAFADVFRMIASVEGPSTSTAVNAPPDTSPPESDEAAEAAESENEASEAESKPETDAASSVPAQPLAETKTKTEAEAEAEAKTETEAEAEAKTETEIQIQKASSESEPSVGPVADADADSDSDARGETESEASAGPPSLEEPPSAADQQAVTEASVGAAPGNVASVAGTNPAASAGLENAFDGQTSTPDAAATTATTAAAAATGLAVEESGESTSTTGDAEADADADEVVPARYAGEPQDARDRQSSGSHRRLRGQDRDKRTPSDAGQADQSGSTSSSSSAARTQASNAAAQASVATNIDSSSLAAGQLAFAEPVATAAMVPPAAAAAQTLPATAAAASSAESLKGSGSDTAATTRTGTAPTAGTEPTVNKDVRSATAGKEANEGPRVADRALLVQRVSRAFQRLGFDGGQVRIRLHPEELGGVQLQLSVQGQRMSGRVVAETEAARSILTQHLPELRQRLADQGMQVERLEVQLEGEQDSTSGSDLMNRDSAGQGRAGQGDRSPQRGPRRQAENRGLPVEQTTTAPQPGGGPRSVIEAAKQKTVDLIG